MNTVKAQTIFIVSFVLFVIFGSFIGLDYNSMIYGGVIVMISQYIADFL